MPKLNNNYNSQRLAGQLWAANGTRVEFALDSAYTHLTSGDGLAIRYFAKEASPITEALIFLDTIFGTLGNISLRCRIYDEYGTASSAAPTRPGPNLRATADAVVMPGSVDNWIKAEFTSAPYTPAKGEILWLVFDNVSGAPGTDYPGIMTATTTANQPNSNTVAFTGYQSTAGFSGNGTEVNEMPAVVVHANGVVVGRTVTQTGNWGTNTLERGMIITPPVDIEVDGIWFNVASAGVASLNVYDFSEPPGGTPLYTYATGVDANQLRDEWLGYKVLPTPILLSAGNTYRVTIAYSANAATPSYGEVQGYSAYSAIFDELVDDFCVCRGCQDDGAGGWTDYGDRYISMVLSISDLPISGGAGLIAPANLRGNLQ